MFQPHQHSAEDTEAEFIQLYAKIAQTLAVSGVVGQNPAALLSIQMPGVVVPPGLDPDDPETEYYVSNLLNTAIECNYVSTPKAGLTSDVYKLILDGKETPLIELSRAEKEKLRAAEKYLSTSDGVDSPAFQAYRACADFFYAAQDALCTAEATHRNGGAGVPAAVRQEYKKALKNWETKGNKAEVEEALATVRQLQARDPFVFWQGLADRFERSTMRLKNGSEFQRHESLPRYEEWFKDELWTAFSFDEKDYRRQPRSGGTGMHGRCECCCAPGRSDGVRRMTAEAVAAPFWHDQGRILASAGSPGSADYGPGASVATGQMQLKCSIKRINILRPWMDTSVFYSRLWKWSPQSIGRGIVVSTGGSVAGNRIATGILPVLPTVALLAKDIELTTTSKEAFEWITAKLRAGNKVRYGPWLIDAIRPPRENELRGADAIVGVASGAPQLFGYISTIFDQCPNPDMTLPWPS